MPPRSFPSASRSSPTRFDGGRGQSRPRFASAISPEQSSRTPHGVGISQVLDLTAGTFQPHPCCLDADSENGRDLLQGVPWNIFQQKHLPIMLAQPEGSENGALKSPWPIESCNGSPAA